MSDDAIFGWLGICVGWVAAVLIGVLMGLPTAHDDGYCAALGGERIATATCNVDGRVVTIDED